MDDTADRIAFGPAPSRRLGRSLGVNNVPFKSCSYACVYCQLGPTGSTETVPRRLLDTDRIVEAVRRRLDVCRRRGEAVDVVTIVPDGEPTLDENLGTLLDALRPLGLPRAVISNGSLLLREEVRARLARADVVSLKVDAGDRETWQRINRPDPRLDFDEVLRGMVRFAASYGGRLLTETMLVGGVNDAPAQVEATALVVRRLSPATAYLAVPTRPCAVRDAAPPRPEGWARARAAFEAHVDRVELLSEAEGTDFGATGDAETDLLATAAVHPLRADQVAALLERDGADLRVVAHLIATGRLRHLRQGGRTWFTAAGGPSPA